MHAAGEVTDVCVLKGRHTCAVPPELRAAAVMASANHVAGTLKVDWVKMEAPSAVIGGLLR